MLLPPPLLLFLLINYSLGVRVLHLRYVTVSHPFLASQQLLAPLWTLWFAVSLLVLILERILSTFSPETPDVCD